MRLAVIAPRSLQMQPTMKLFQCAFVVIVMLRCKFGRTAPRRADMRHDAARRLIYFCWLPLVAISRMTMPPSYGAKSNFGVTPFHDFFAKCGVSHGNSGVVCKLASCLPSALGLAILTYCIYRMDQAVCLIWWPCALLSGLTLRHCLLMPMLCSRNDGNSSHFLRDINCLLGPMTLFGLSQVLVVQVVLLVLLHLFDQPWLFPDDWLSSLSCWDSSCWDSSCWDSSLAERLRTLFREQGRHHSQH